MAAAVRPRHVAPPRCGGGGGYFENKRRRVRRDWAGAFHRPLRAVFASTPPSRDGNVALLFCLLVDLWPAFLWCALDVDVDVDLMLI
jgi:hypothetical protein